MTSLIKGKAVSLLIKGERKWTEKRGTVLENNGKILLVQFQNYRESFMKKDFENGLVKIKG